ncbi:MAG: hypothetical protein PXY39_14625 [archaeon]|nr:hypothetical protein [archaeon]
MSAQTNRRRERQVLQTTEDVMRLQVPRKPVEEIERYLRLFGYKPERSILQVHTAGYFGKSRLTPKEVSQREKTSARHDGRTFVVVGRTHDPTFPSKLIPRRKASKDQNPGYIGYLFKGKDEDQKPPHELLPLDFVPGELTYPKDWKDMFGTRGYLITMHVPLDFAPKKNNLLRQLRRLKGKALIKEPWTFLDDLENYGYAKNEVENFA